MKKGNRAGLILFILFFIAVPLVLLLSVFDYGPNPLSFAAEDYLGMTLNEMAEIWGDDYIYTDKTVVRKDGKKYAWQGVRYKDNRNKLTCYIPVDPGPLKPKITGDEPIELVFFWKETLWINDKLDGRETESDLLALGAQYGEMRTGNRGLYLAHESGCTTFDNGMSIYVMKDPSVLLKEVVAFEDLPHLSEVHAALIIPEMSNAAYIDGGEATGKYITDQKELAELLGVLKKVRVIGQRFEKEEDVVYSSSAPMLIRFYSDEPMRLETLTWEVILDENASSYRFNYTSELAAYTIRDVEGAQTVYDCYNTSAAEETEFFGFWSAS